MQFKLRSTFVKFYFNTPVTKQIRFVRVRVKLPSFPLQFILVLRPKKDDKKDLKNHEGLLIRAVLLD